MPQELPKAADYIGSVQLALQALLDAAGFTRLGPNSELANQPGALVRARISWAAGSAVRKDGKQVRGGSAYLLVFTKERFDDEAESESAIKRALYSAAGSGINIDFVNVDNLKRREVPPLARSKSAPELPPETAASLAKLAARLRAADNTAE